MHTRRWNSRGSINYRNIAIVWLVSMLLLCGNGYALGIFGVGGTTEAGPGGEDTNAIHDNVSGEIAAIADKATPVSADRLLIEDSAASFAKKDATVGSLTSIYATDTELTTHEADTSSVHGIADTTVLATDAELATHAADTTSVHGITDTTVLATDAELATHEADTSSVHGITDTTVLATDAELASHEADTSNVHGIVDMTVLASDAELAAHAADSTAIHGITDTSVLLKGGTLTDTKYCVYASGTGLVNCNAEGGAGGGDDAAIHDNVAGEIAAITAKATPVGADYLLIEDSAASNAKKSATITSLTSVYATDTELATHEADTTVHGIDTTALATDSELATHAADSTSVHGITDTSVLATATSVATAVSTHEADTTDVHGIANTAVLATDTELAAHESDTTSVHGIADTTLLLTGGTLTDAKLCTWNDTAGVVQCNTDPAEGLGDVVGPASSTDNALVRFHETTGKIVQNSSATLDDAGVLTVTDVEIIASSSHGGLLRLCEDADLDPENDCFVIRVPDGLNIPDGETIHDVRSDAKLKATAIAGNYVVTNSKSANYTLGTDDPMEMYGGVLYVTAAATITVPAVAVGQSFSVITIGAVAVSVDPNASDRIILDGTALSDGDKATNTSTTGDMLVCTYESVSGWYCASGSNDGDPWTDTN